MSTSAALLDQGRALPGVEEGTHSRFPALHVCEAVLGVLRSNTHDTAIDEGCFVGIRTGALTTDEGLDVPPAGSCLRPRPRARDIVTVEDGMAVSHRHDLDQLDLVSQLGLTESRGDTGRREACHRRHVPVIADRSRLEAGPAGGSSTGVSWRAATGHEAAVRARCPAPLSPVRPA
jgi:hypothetical protein